MKKELDLLKEIQSLDTVILKENSLLSKAPQLLDKYEKPFKESEKALEKSESDLTNATQRQRTLEVTLEEIKDKSKKLKLRASDLKTNKEYQAHLLEIQKVEEDIGKVEEDILIAMERVDEKKRALAASKENFDRENDKVIQLKKELERKQVEARKNLDTLLIKREKLSQSIPPDLHDKYISLFESKNSLAVVRVKDEICLGCNMKMPPQRFAEVIKCDKLIICPQCGRILYFEQEQEQAV